MLTRGVFIGEIVDSLSDLANQANMRGKCGLTDLNKFAEDFFKTALNHLYGYNLINLNQGRSNEPGLDLGDKAKGVAFQITSTKTSPKVQSTIEKLSDDQITSYPKVYVLIIGTKQTSYTLGGTLYEERAAKSGFSEANIWDIETLCRQCMDIKIDTLQTLYNHVRSEMNRILASFREQGLTVSQPLESPDFHIQNTNGGEAWVEAVTANPVVPYNHVNAPIGDIPTEKEEIFFGPTAVRFAKTLGNKLVRKYDQMDHVKGKPFILAIADFQASASMMWSREGLIGYLYGEGAQVGEIDGMPAAVSLSAPVLQGPSKFPAGLFANDENSGLSAVIFSNACSIAKLNRVAITGRGAPTGLRYTRMGEFFDRTQGALKGIPFCLDITSEEYRRLWPHGYEPWTAELEVFHNPFATHQTPIELFPEATHWIEQDGERVCTSMYETSILWSRTMITDVDQKAPTLDDLLQARTGNATDPHE